MDGSTLTKVKQIYHKVNYNLLKTEQEIEPKTPASILVLDASTYVPSQPYLT